MLQVNSINYNQIKTLLKKEQLVYLERHSQTNEQ